MPSASIGIAPIIDPLTSMKLYFHNQSIVKLDRFNGTNYN